MLGVYVCQNVLQLELKMFDFRIRISSQRGCRCFIHRTGEPGRCRDEVLWCSSIQRVAGLSSSLEDCGWPRVGFVEDYVELKTPTNGDMGGRFMW